MNSLCRDGEKIRVATLSLFYLIFTIVMFCLDIVPCSFVVGSSRNRVRTYSTLIKKKIKFSSYKRKFGVAKTYMRKGFLIYEKMRKYFPI
jgi:hypothetical protein